MIVATGPTSRTVPSMPADADVVAGVEPLAEVVAGQDAGHHVAAAQPERQAEAQGQAAEGDEDQLVQQGELKPNWLKAAMKVNKART